MISSCLSRGLEFCFISSGLIDLITVYFAFAKYKYLLTVDLISFEDDAFKIIITLESISGKIETDI